ncbi:MAG: response regulator transcription factor [Burkholderiales bacterium]|nr:response regulator transcription factor [Burkholderiales bacterium]
MKTARIAALRPPHGAPTAPRGSLPVADGILPPLAAAGITPEVDALMRGMLMARPGLLCLVDAASGGVVQLRGTLPHSDPSEEDAPPLGQVGQPYRMLLESIVPEDGEDRRRVLEALTDVRTGVRPNVEVGPLQRGADGYLEIIVQRLPAPGNYLLVGHFDVTRRQCMRALLKRDQPRMAPLNINAAVRDAARMAGGGALFRCTLPRPRTGGGRPRSRTRPRTLALIVDHDQTVLTGLGRMLHSAGFGVETFSSSLDLLQREPTDEAGCIVMNLHMPALDGLRTLEILKQQGCSMPVLFLAEEPDMASCVRAMKGGASNFLIKPPDEKELIAVIRQAVTEHEVVRERLHWRREWQHRFGRLSPREYQVCRLVALGLLNKQIAGQLGLAEKTVKIHRGQAMRKLGLRSVAELVRVVDRLNPPDDVQRVAGQAGEQTSPLEDDIFVAERDKFDLRTKVP